MDDSIQSTVCSIHSLWVGIGILVAVISVVPIQNEHATVWPNFLRDRHKPNIVGGQEIRFAKPLVCRARSFHSIAVQATAVDITHVELVAVLFWIRGRIKVLDAAVCRHLVFVFDDGIRGPSVRRIRSPLALVIGRFGQVPEVIDNACADERTSFAIKSDSPWVTRPLAKQIKFFRDWVDAKHRTGEVKHLAILFDNRAIKDSIESIQATIRAPS